MRADALPRLTRTNHYERLGVERDATHAELRDAYRIKAMAMHPDRRGDAADTDMAAINEAWRVLGDAGRRAAYDDSIAPPPAPAPSTARPAPAPAPPGWDDGTEDADLDGAISHSDAWTRKWVLAVGFLTLLTLGFGAMLLWIALGGGT